jgi:putative ABC transport system permease protein
MRIFQSFHMALKNILSNKMRSFLTMLGIIIGVSGVIVIVGMGNGMENYMTESFQDIGTNLLTVSIMGTGSSENVDIEDMYRLVEENPEYLKDVTPEVSVPGSVKVGSETLKMTGVTGVSETYAELRRFELNNGRFLQYADILKRSNVCIVGSYIEKSWFAGNAVGKTLKINGITFSVIGTFKEESDSTEGSGDDTVFIPYSTASRMSSSTVQTVTSYTFVVMSEDTIPQTKEIIGDALYEVYGTEDAYRIISMSEMLDMMNTMINIMVTVLAAIAAISLVVGGIGIMNIMLVSVSERTREIGIRKALGAKQRFIMQQFVIEAATVSALGGVVGIGFGYLLSMVATIIIKGALGEDLTVSPSAGSILMAVGISAAIGILFGYLPARKAARLNPIDALRYE